MNKVKIFLVLFALASASSVVASEFVQKKYKLVESEGGGYINVAISHIDKNNAANNALVKKAIETNEISIKSKNVSVKEYKQAWLWGNTVILSVNYTKQSRDFLWRESFSIDNGNLYPVTGTFDQLFEITYISMLREYSEAKVSQVDLFESYVTLSEPEAKPIYRKSTERKDVEWSVAFKRNVIDFEKKDNVWISAEKPKDTLHGAVAEFLNNYSINGYSFFSDTKLCKGTCRRKDYGLVRYEHGDDGQKGLRLSSELEFWNYLQKWNKVSVLGHVSTKMGGVVYLQPKLSFMKQGENFDEKFPIVPLSIIKEGRKIIVTPGIKNDLDSTLLSNRYILESIRLNWVN